MREKTFKNSPKGRFEIPEKSGEYMLLDGHGNNVYWGCYGGWNRAVNLKERIKEHHYDKSKQFKFIKIRR